MILQAFKRAASLILLGTLLERSHSLAMEFSKEEISLILAIISYGSQNENILYFRPTQDFAGEIEITIYATSTEGGSVSEVGSSSTNFEIQDGNVTFEYISFSISDHARNIIFKDEIKLQYEIDTGNYSLWHEAAQF